MSTQIVERHALKPGAPPRDVIDILKKLSEREPERWIIRCPVCSWKPAADSRWSCLDTGHPEYYSHGCGQSWHSFATRGRCPGCTHQWRWTACLSCQAWSHHEDWYTFEDHDQ